MGTLSSRKRGLAVDGGLFVIEHPEIDLGGPFSSHIDVLYNGTTHQVRSVADHRDVVYSNVTGEFSVNGMRGHIIESLETMRGAAVHRYQAVVGSASGVLLTAGYSSAAHIAALVGSLRPRASTLGVSIDPDDEAELVSEAKVALGMPELTIECAPLTAEVNAALPDWRGSAVDGGELYAGTARDAAPFLTLITPSCRVLALFEPSQADRAIEVMRRLRAEWAT